MGRLIVFLLLAWANQRACAQNLEWLSDVQAAKDKAKQENKLVLLDFTGSDWCPWCIKLRSEVFDKAEFAEYAQSKLVIMEVDFPHSKPMALLQRQGNRQLAKSYHVHGYPTIIVFNPDGHQVSEIGYVSGGPKAFITRLESIPRIVNVSAPTSPREPELEVPRKPVTFSPIPPAVPIHYGALALKAISGPKDRRIVLINNASMLAGETARVRVDDRDVVVCCTEIREDSVLVTCDGKPLELRLGKH